VLKRKWPYARVGDIFGAFEVIALLPRDYSGNERVRARCVCTRERDCYVFNLRRRAGSNRCPHQRRNPLYRQTHAPSE
jgi:hypothetical protein